MTDHLTLRADAEVAQKQQARTAIQQLTNRGDGVPWPWPAMQAVFGNINSGSVHFLCAPSGNGKTTVALSLVLEWLAAGYQVVLGGFERDTGSLRRLLAAMTLGINPGDVLGGEWESWSDYEQAFDAMQERLEEMANTVAPWGRLFLIEHDHVSEQAIKAMGEMALAHPHINTICVVDHIDHLGPEGARNYGASVQATHAIHSHAKQHGTRWVVMSQMHNKSGVLQGGPWWRHKPQGVAAVKNGQHKEEVCWTMGGIYRPLRPDVTADDLKAVLDDRKPIKDVLFDGVTAINVMKHRDHGSRVGQRVLVGWEHGRIVDAPSSVKFALEQKVHGIRTSTGFDA